MKNNPLAYKGYIGIAGYSQYDGVFNGKVFGINDLVTFEAESTASLEAVFVEAVDDYLETCAELGKVPDKPIQL